MTALKKKRRSSPAWDRYDFSDARHITYSLTLRFLYTTILGKPEGKRPLGRPRRRWEDNNKMDLQEVWCGGVDWFELAQYRVMWRALVTAVMNLRVP
jgi:hypothetical protein